MATDGIGAAMRRLRAAEQERREAVERLIVLGVVRSKRLVADLGEEIAARFYGVQLAANANEPGYDLVAQDGRLVQVRALRSEPHRERTVMGQMKEPYDTLFAVKLSVEYDPLRAIEVPRSVLEAHYPHGVRTSWTKRLEQDPRVRRIDRKELRDLIPSEHDRGGIVDAMPQEDLDFSNLPGDAALLLSQQKYTRRLAHDLARSMRLEPPGVDLLHQEIVGAVAEVVEGYLP